MGQNNTLHRWAHCAPVNEVWPGQLWKITKPCNFIGTMVKLKINLPNSSSNMETILDI